MLKNRVFVSKEKKCSANGKTYYMYYYKCSICDYTAAFCNPKAVDSKCKICKDNEDYKPYLSMSDEVWKAALLGTRSLLVSNYGNVKNEKGNLIGARKSRGYRAIHLTILGKNKKILIHRIVADAFIPNPENKPQINHKNGIKDDNRVENLEWATGSENTKHAFDVLGRKVQVPRGILNHRSKPVKSTDANGEVTYYPSISSVGRGSDYITDCCKGRIAVYLERKWEYVSKEEYLTNCSDSTNA